MINRLETYFSRYLITNKILPPPIVLTLIMYSDGTLTEEEINYQLARINESKIPSIIATLSVLSALATISVFLRFLVRWHTTAGYKMDDWTILAAFVRI